MKGLTKITMASLIAVLVATMGVAVLAETTQGTASTGSSQPPVVLAKAEWLAGTWDDDSSKPHLQVNPPGA